MMDWNMLVSRKPALAAAAGTGHHTWWVIVRCVGVLCPDADIVLVGLQFEAAEITLPELIDSLAMMRSWVKQIRHS